MSFQLMEVIVSIISIPQQAHLVPEHNYIPGSSLQQYVRVVVLAIAFPCVGVKAIIISHRDTRG